MQDEDRNIETPADEPRVDEQNLDSLDEGEAAVGGNPDELGGKTPVGPSPEVSVSAPIVEVDEHELKDDDRVPAVVGDAEVNDEPVRSAQPDVPVLGSLAVGAGQHQPPSSEEFDEQGRPKATPSTAFAEPDEEASNRSAEQREADPSDPYKRPSSDDS